MLRLRKKDDKSLVGLEIEAGSVAAAEVHVNGGARLTGAAIAPLPAGAFHDGEVADPEAVAATLKSLFAKNKLSPRVRLGIANQRVVVRTMRLPMIDDPGQLEAAVRFEAEEQIPMPIEQAVLDYRVVGGSGQTADEAPKIDVIVVAARRELIDSSLGPLRDAGLQPVGVDLSAFGLIRALTGAWAAAPQTTADGNAATPPTVLCCNVGDITNLAVAKGSSCLFTRVSPAGLGDIVGSLSGSTGLAPEHARMWLSHVGLAQPVEQIAGDPALISQVRTALEEGASALLDELRLSLDFYGAQEESAPVERVLLSGPAATIPGLAEWMAPVLGIPVEAPLPQALSGFDSASAARLTLSYGLALEE